MQTELKIDRFEGGKVVLKTKTGSSIIWPKEDLPENLREGQTLYISVEDRKNGQLAHDIINEILTEEKDD